MKILILISSYNRFNSLLRLLNQITKQDTDYEYDIIVSDDSSTDVRYKNLNKYIEKDLTIIKTKKNNGKTKYWLTINSALSLIREKEFDLLIQLDDDFEICENFLNKTIDLFIKNINENNKIAAMSLHLNSQVDLNGSRWSLGSSWVDGGTIYTKKIIENLNFKIDPINEKRWIVDKKLSSGVWQQLSVRINKLGYYIIKPNYSFLNHSDDNDSKMNLNTRKENPINTYNFIDNFEDEKNSIFKINLPSNLPTNNKDWWIKKRTL
jgi:hypothetical protein